MSTHRSRFTIRSKLLVLALAVLAIPYAGLEYLRELERHLRDSLESGLTDAARAIAGPLHDRNNLFPENPGSTEHTMYAHRLSHRMQVDGYVDDWLAYIGWSDASVDQPALSFRFLIGRYDPYYFCLLQVHDDRIIYQHPETPDAVDNDHVGLVFTDPHGQLQRYYFSPAAPGRIRPFSFHQHWDEYGFEYKTTDFITNVSGEWQLSENGYNLEIAIPTSVVGDRLGLVVADVDDPDSRQVRATVGTAGEETLDRPGGLVQPSLEIVRLIERFADVEGRRLWVLDTGGQVLASAGSLEKPLPDQAAGLLYRLILPPPHERFTDDLAGASRLQGREVLSALEGRTEARWRASPDGRAIIVSAAAPVYGDDAVRGVTVVEETTGGLQMLQRRAMISLFNKTFLVFMFITGAVLLFATRLSYRLRRLSLAAEAAIDEHGRVIGAFETSRAGDEIGELSRSYAAMLARLREYNSYLESLAGKLSHELRTPLTVVRSSLEHLRDGCPPDLAPVYLSRAREGVERLGFLVSRLSEAARLEQALAQSETRMTDIGDLLGRCLEGYRLGYGDVEFALSLPESRIRGDVAPDLFEQMLDKLIANAVDFRREGTPVDVALDVQPGWWTVSVVNRGAALPAAMQGQLFNSMISIRDERGRGPHLGLGLYIVRLIAEFHGARVRAETLQDGSGVRFSIDFPADT